MLRRVGKGEPSCHETSAASLPRIIVRRRFSRRFQAGVRSFRCEVHALLQGRTAMKYKTLSLHSDFEVAFAARQVQAAEMTLAPGSNTGGPDNRHRGADQWMYVVSGTGLAVIDGVQQPLQAGSLLVIEHGETHEIRCTGGQPLRTVNFYSPPAYDDDGEPLPAGEG